MSSDMTALELLKLGDTGRTRPFLTVYWPHIIGTFFGIGSACAINFGTRRPLFSGIQKHVVSVAGWVALLNFVQNKRADYLAEKNAVLIHYVELHPEDFPVPAGTPQNLSELTAAEHNIRSNELLEVKFDRYYMSRFIRKIITNFVSIILAERKRIGEILEPWVPVR